MRHPAWYPSKYIGLCRSCYQKLICAQENQGGGAEREAMLAIIDSPSPSALRRVNVSPLAAPLGSPLHLTPPAVLQLRASLTLINVKRTLPPSNYAAVDTASRVVDQAISTTLPRDSFVNCQFNHICNVSDTVPYLDIFMITVISATSGRKKVKVNMRAT